MFFRRIRVDIDNGRTNRHILMGTSDQIGMLAAAELWWVVGFIAWLPYWLTFLFLFIKKKQFKPFHYILMLQHLGVVNQVPLYN